MKEIGFKLDLLCDISASDLNSQYKTVFREPQLKVMLPPSKTVALSDGKTNPITIIAIKITALIIKLSQCLACFSYVEKAINDTKRQ